MLPASDICPLPDSYDLSPLLLSGIRDGEERGRATLDRPGEYQLLVMEEAGQTVTVSFAVQ